MVDERQRVIRDLLIRLAEAGIVPDRPFDAVFVPGLGWTFEQDPPRDNGSSSSSSAGVPREKEYVDVQTSAFVPSRK